MDDFANPFFEQPKPHHSKSAAFINVLQGIVIVMAIGIVFYLFIITPNQIDGFSMYPTFDNDELVLTNRIIQWVGGTDIGKQIHYDYQHGDVIVFQEPDHPELIKRIIGLPGDSVSVDSGQVLVNGKVIEEKYLDPSLRTQGGDFLQEGDTKIVPGGYFFVMGDNRGNSLDSRFSYIGLLKREYIKGRVIIRFWPLNKFQIIETGKTVTADT